MQQFRGGVKSVGPGWLTEYRFRSVRSSASSTDPLAVGSGRRPPPVPSYDSSPPRLGSADGSRHSNYGTPTPSNSREKEWRSTSSNASSVTPTLEPPRPTCKASTPQRSSTPSDPHASPQSQPPPALPLTDRPASLRTSPSTRATTRAEAARSWPVGRPGRSLTSLTVSGRDPGARMRQASPARCWPRRASRAVKLERADPALSRPRLSPHGRGRPAAAHRVRSTAMATAIATTAIVTSNA